MRIVDQRLMLSASDLMRFMGCAHATALDLARLRGEGPEPAADSEDAALLQARGDAHEAAFLDRLKTEGRRVGAIEPGGTDLAATAARPREALAGGPNIVFQGALASAAWGGYSDFWSGSRPPPISGRSPTRSPTPS